LVGFPEIFLPYLTPKTT
jgi:hypothetical protein